MSRKPSIGFVWSHFSTHHSDRCAAVSEAMNGRARVVGIEVAGARAGAAPNRNGEANGFVKVTLFPGRSPDAIPAYARLRAVLGAALRQRVTHVFLAGHHFRSGFVIALVLRLLGRRVYVMLDAKFDDQPRRLWREIVKAMLLLPYHGGLASGGRAADYLRLLGLRRRPIALGCNSLSLARLRALAPDPPPAWEERPFLIVARMVPQKNLSTALHAFARYRERAAPARRLRLCGDGPLQAELRATAAALQIADDVDFLGAQLPERIALEMSRAHCLLLPSIGERWGLVVNEALAFGLPVLVADNVGAQDALVGSLDNGLVLDPGDVEAWSEALLALGRDPVLWSRFAEGSRRRAPRADLKAFVEGCEALLRMRPAGIA